MAQSLPFGLDDHPDEEMGRGRERKEREEMCRDGNRKGESKKMTHKFIDRYTIPHWQVWQTSHVLGNMLMTSYSFQYNLR